MNNNNWQPKIVRFLTAQTISLFGSSLVQYAIIWYVTLETSSGAMMTISTVCGFAPQILISLFAGVWIDRYDRKKMIMIADTMIASATLVSATLFVMGYDMVWVLFAVLLVRSAGAGIQTPAVQAIIPQIVPKENLMRVNGINSTITALTMLLSPVISGAILSVAGIELTMFIDVLTAAICIGMMFTIAIPRQVGSMKSGNTHLQDIKVGFAYLKKNATIRNLIIFTIVVGILVSPSAFLTPLLVSRSFGAEVWKLTVSEMTFSAGAALGGLFIASRGGFKNRMLTTILAAFCYGLMMVFMGLATSFVIYLIVNFAIGITMPCYSTPITVQIQEHVEPQMHGRVFSLLQVANSCSLPLGMMLFGPLADVTSVQTLLICAGSAVLCCTAYAALGRKLAA